MKEFVIESMCADGNIVNAATFTSDQNLLNDFDLFEVVSMAKGVDGEEADAIVTFEKKMDVDDINHIIIREKYDTSNVYYFNDGWTVGLRENAINTIKRRL